MFITMFLFLFLIADNIPLYEYIPHFVFVCPPIDGRLAIAVNVSVQILILSPCF